MPDKLLHHLQHLDRRWVFLGMALSVGVPVLMGMRFPEKPSEMARVVFQSIEELPRGSRILMALDYDPASQGELHPMAAAFTRHGALKGHKLYFMTLWPAGTGMIQDHINTIEREFPEYRYGTDYVNLGFRAGMEGVIKNIATNLRKTYGSDVYGTGLDQLPVTRDLKNIQQMDLIVNVSAGDPGTKQWVQYAATPFDIEMVTGTTGVQAPLLLPYVPNQVAGILKAIKGAAEYEQVLIEAYPDLADNDRAQEALRRMGPQLVAHLYLILLIVGGNVIYFLERRKST